MQHSLRAEAVGALTLYGRYELARGLVGADTRTPTVTPTGSSCSNARCIVVEANVPRDTTRVSTELGEGDTASTNPPAVEVLLAGAEGATFLALVSRG